MTWDRVAPAGKPMGESTNETVDGHGTELEIANVDFDDAGTYRCSATNVLGQTPATVDINLVVHGMTIAACITCTADQTSLIWLTKTRYGVRMGTEPRIRDVSRHPYRSCLAT